MRIFRDIRLLKLARDIEARWPGVTVGWNLEFTGAHPDETDTILEVFSVEDHEELGFLTAVLPLVREVERELGIACLILSHDSESTKDLYASAPDRIRAWRETLPTWELSVRWALERLATPRAA